MLSQSKKISVIISYIATILNYVALFFVTPITIRMLGKQEFGLYSLVTSVIGYLALLSLGLGSAYVRFFFRIKARKNQITVDNLNGMYFLTYIFLALLVIIFGAIFILFSQNIFGPKLTLEEHNIAKTLLLILVVNLAMTFIFSVFWSYTRAIEHFVTLEIVHLIKVLLGPMITIPTLLLGFGSIGFVLATTFISTTIEIVVVIYALKKGKIRFKFNMIDWTFLKEIFTYSMFIFGFQLLDQLNSGVDNMILGWTGGTEIISIYAVGSSIAAIILSLPNGITSVSIPQINRISSNDDYSFKIEQVNQMQFRYGRLIFIVIAFIISGFIILGFPFLDFWAGTGYKDAYYIVLILTVPKMFGYTLAISSEFIKAENLHKTRLIIYGVTILFNIAISIPLAIIIGPIGASIGTGIAYSIYIVFMYFYYSKSIGIDLSLFLRELIKITSTYVAIIVPFILFSNFVNLKNLWIFLSIGVGYVFTFVIINYWFIINDYEKGLIGAIFKKFKKPSTKKV